MSAIVAAPLATPMAHCSVGRFGHGGVASGELPRGAVRPRDDRTVTSCEAGEPFISVRFIDERPRPVLWPTMGDARKTARAGPRRGSHLWTMEMRQIGVVPNGA
jgi:hypothetical protein